MPVSKPNNIFSGTLSTAATMWCNLCFPTSIQTLVKGWDALNPLKTSKVTFPPRYSVSSTRFALTTALSAPVSTCILHALWPILPSTYRPGCLMAAITDSDLSLFFSFLHPHSPTQNCSRTQLLLLWAVRVFMGPLSAPKTCRYKVNSIHQIYLEAFPESYSKQDYLQDSRTHQAAGYGASPYCLGWHRNVNASPREDCLYPLDSSTSLPGYSMVSCTAVVCCGIDSSWVVTQSWSWEV